MGVEVEGAGDQHVEAGIHRLAGGGDDVLPADGAVFRPDQDGGAALGTVLAFDECAAGPDEVARPGRQALEGDAVALGLLLDALGLQVVDDDGGEILAREIGVGRGASALGGFDLVDQFLFARRQHAMGRQALDRERAGDADAGIVDVGLVVEIFDVGAGGDARRRFPADGRCAPPTIWRGAPWLKRARRRAARAEFAIPHRSCRARR